MEQCLPKGWLLGIQFLGLFEHDAFFGYAKQSVVLAQKIQSKLQELGYALFMKSDTNQIFCECIQGTIPILK